MTAPCWDIENQCRAQGYRIICGVDEAGRGPLAGPVAAAAVILPYAIEGLDDSKKLSPEKRKRLRAQIQETALAYAVSIVDVETIAALNILQAAMLAMRQAIAMLSPAPEIALIDGNYAKGFDLTVRAVTGGDRKSASIAAASILAKEARDEIMVELDQRYPGYGFAQHKGYGTKAHYQALARLGPCPVHRLGFRLG